MQSVFKLKISFQVVQYDLHLAGREEFAVDGAQLVGERLYPAAHGALVHLPAGGQLPEGHGMEWYWVFGHGLFVLDDLEGVWILERVAVHLGHGGLQGGIVDHAVLAADDGIGGGKHTLWV